MAGRTKRCFPLLVISPTSRPRFLFGFAFLLATVASAADSVQPNEKTETTFGADVQLTPFVVNGQKLSISVHARTASDRRYATEFAEEVVGIAYETMGKSTGAGLVIVGREGEPHPVMLIRKFLAMAAAGQLDPALAEKTGEMTALMERWKATLNLDKDDDGEKEFKITFDMLMPALPLPLEGLGSKLYQLSWAEGFDDVKVEKKLRALTVADLESDALSKYDWVFYLPPRNAYVEVQDQLMKEVMKKEKMGIMKRAAIKSALLVFKPAVKKAVEGFRKGMLFMTVLRARSGWKQDDIKLLTGAYVQVLMPDFKFNGGTERIRALEAIEKQKIKNAEYAKDPFVSPVRLATFDVADYARFEGEYGTIPLGKDGKPGKPSRVLQRSDAGWNWHYRRGKPSVLYPAGERLFVSADGKLTVQFLINDQGVVTGAEERRERYRQTFPWPAHREEKKK